MARLLRQAPHLGTVAVGDTQAHPLLVHQGGQGPRRIPRIPPLQGEVSVRGYKGVCGLREIQRDSHRSAGANLAQFLADCCRGFIPLPGAAHRSVKPSDQSPVWRDEASAFANKRLELPSVHGASVLQFLASLWPIMCIDQHRGFNDRDQRLQSLLCSMQNESECQPNQLCPDCGVPMSSDVCITAACKAQKRNAISDKTRAGFQDLISMSRWPRVTGHSRGLYKG